jgi:hypothetical protein
MMQRVNSCSHVGYDERSDNLLREHTRERIKKRQISNDSCWGKWDIYPWNFTKSGLPSVIDAPSCPLIPSPLPASPQEPSGAMMNSAMFSTGFVAGSQQLLDLRKCCWTMS